MAGISLRGIAAGEHSTVNLVLVVTVSSSWTLHRFVQNNGLSFLVDNLRMKCRDSR